MRLFHIPEALLGVIIVTLSVLLAVAMLHVVRHRKLYLLLKSSNDMSGPVYSMVGVLYAVLLAFMVIVVWEQYAGAEEHAQAEASAVVDLLRDAQAFPPETRDKLQASLINYTNDVVHDEWVEMAQGQPVEPESGQFNQIWMGYLAYQPETTVQIAFYNESITRLNDLGRHRKLRILSSQSELPAALWILLIGGGIIVTLFACLFWTESEWVHILMVGLLAGLLGFVLFLILSLEHPFNGDLSIKPDAFQHVLEIWKARAKQQ